MDSNNKRYIKEFFRNIIDRFKFKGRTKKFSTNWNWPQLNKYCGCCEVSTGIYIRSVVTLIISSVSFFLNATILDYLFSIENIVYNVNLTSVKDDVITSKDDDLATLQIVYQLMVVYYIMWIIVKAIYVITVVFTAFAVYKKITWMLKVLLFISVPNWVLDFFMCFFGTIMLTEALKVTLIICNLSEGYNILAINSEYKRLRGKSRLAVEDPEPQSEQTYVDDYISQHNERYHSGYTQLHCRSCTCFQNTWNISNQVRPDVISSEPVATNAIENPNQINDVVVNSSNANDLDSFNETVRAEESSSEVTEPNQSQFIRPNTLDLKPKEDISDTPVIYDEQQLNVGSSPVIEDRRVLPND